MKSTIYPPPRQCWVCEPSLIALKTRGPQLCADFAGPEVSQTERPVSFTNQHLHIVVT
jgi:hypothetical protein